LAVFDEIVSLIRTRITVPVSTRYNLTAGFTGLVAAGRFLNTGFLRVWANESTVPNKSTSPTKTAKYLNLNIFFILTILSC
jgi:hypothetical protein